MPTEDADDAADDAEDPHDARYERHLGEVPDSRGSDSEQLPLSSPPAVPAWAGRRDGPSAILPQMRDRPPHQLVARGRAAARLRADGTAHSPSHRSQRRSSGHNTPQVISLAPGQPGTTGRPTRTDRQSRRPRPKIPHQTPLAYTRIAPHPDRADTFETEPGVIRLRPRTYSIMVGQMVSNFPGQSIFLDNQETYGSDATPLAVP